MEEGRVGGEAAFGEDVEVAGAYEDTVGGGVGVEPAGEGVGGLDEEELTVVVGDLDGEGGEGGGDVEEEKDDEPFVLQVVAELGFSTEVGRERPISAAAVSAAGGAEVEGLVLPDVVGDEGGDGVEDAESEVGEIGGGGGVAGIGKEGVEDGVVGEAVGDGGHGWEGRRNFYRLRSKNGAFLKNYADGLMGFLYCGLSFSFPL